MINWGSLNAGPVDPAWNIPGELTENTWGLKRRVRRKRRNRGGLHRTARNTLRQCTLASPWTGRTAGQCEFYARIQKYAHDGVPRNLAAWLSWRESMDWRFWSTEINTDSHSGQEYGPGPREFISRCNSMRLDWNISKTKQMLISLSKKALSLQPEIVNGTQVNVVEEYKYLDQFLCCFWTIKYFKMV